MRNPVCNNHFQVEWGGDRIGFMEVSGLAMELAVVSFREGASTESQPRLMPGALGFDPVVLRRALVPGDNAFFEWIQTASFGTVERRDVTVSLLDAAHQPVVVWKLRNAFPSRLAYSPLQADGNEVAVESLTLVHEGLVVQRV
jgi:phage tail-like protein